MTKRKEYSEEFKQEAVRLARESGKTTETARNLGLHLSVLCRWKKRSSYKQAQRSFLAKGMSRMRSCGSCKGRISA